jgi:four helix bundle protein
MGEVLNYKDLPVVQRAFELVRGVDTVIEKLPRTPQGRTVGDQLFRAASSIGANIAEGRGRDFDKEYERYLRIARASANETDYWLRVARDCHLIDDDRAQLLLGKVDECLRMLSAMITALRKKRGDLIRELPQSYTLATDDETAL